MTTVLFAGSEIEAFASVSGNFSNDASSVVFRPILARAGVGNGNAGVTSSTGFPLADAATTPTFTPVSSFWVHGQHAAFTSGTTLNGIFLAAFDSSGNARIVVRGTGTAGLAKLSTVNSAGTFTDLTLASQIAFNASSLSPIDLFINYSTSGQVQLWVNGVVVADTGTGVNVTTNSVTALSSIAYSAVVNVGNGDTVGWSECIVQDTTTRGAALQTIPPVAAGATQSWTPNTVGNIDEIVNNTSNFVATTSNNALSEWTVSTTLPLGSWTINAVVQAASVSVGSTGPQHFAWDVRTSAGASFQNGSEAPVVGTFSNFQNILLTNPSTGVAWLPGQLVDSGIESLA
jgi:hypothetical protein